MAQVPEFWKNHVFTKLEAELYRAQYYLKSKTKESRDWFMKKVKELGRPTRASVLGDERVTMVSQPKIGQMFTYGYGPKHWRTLPYYDTFPLIIMVGPAKGGFYGINLHYVDPMTRAKFIDKIVETMTNQGNPESTRLQITYDILKASRRYKEFEPCFKHYLGGHVRTKIVRIDPPDWEVAVFLPTETFKKATREQVWQESRKAYK